MCGIKTTGDLWCWGDNTQGLVGDGTTSPASSPELVARGGWSSVSLARSQACGIRWGGELWCWGQSSVGPQSTVPTGPIGRWADWTMIAVDDSGFCGLRNGGEWWCQIPGSTRRIGTGTGWTWIDVDGWRQWGVKCGALAYTSHFDWYAEPRVAGDAGWARVAVSSDHDCRLDASGGVWCSGSNLYGQVGNGKLESYSALSRVGTSSDWVDVGILGAPVLTFSCALARNGQVWCWGQRFGAAPVCVLGC